MEHSAINAQSEQGEPESVVVHVQLRPRRGATRRCLAALAALAAEHEEVSFAVTGLSKDDRVVRVTVGVDLGPRTAVAKFSPQAQAAYAFVSAIFASLYDHMPVYTAEPSGAERAAAATLLETAGAGASAADVLEVLPATSASLVPSPRVAGPGERIPA
ncbi:hypothetical protein [Blastococcus haudaquaticus]|uniref:Uncharacterized protein n=1 Tax=Blastococcus haudaquaticus TaxID=1938745 RepID=A0A286H083_9ACTN|nr:hypothetical protein [Blastococcus haudaquaticus]SOE01200.1 hypothetical protein SAMN06272739_3022 [Blastococcus haudaquaticus]